MATEDDLVRRMLEDVECRCASCERLASVGASDRWAGRWTCYSCGRINRVAPTVRTGRDSRE